MSQILFLYALARCQKVAILDGKTLWGIRSNTPEIAAPLGFPDRYDKPGNSGRMAQILDDFASTDSTQHDQIIRFTKIHGVLEHKPESLDFSMSLRRWRYLHSQFRMLCVMRMEQNPDLRQSSAVYCARPVPVERPEQFELRPRGLFYRTKSLYRLLLLQFLSLPPKAVRLCANRGCDNPIFIDPDLRRKYCGPSCSRAATLASKRKWFDVNRRGEGAP